MSNPNRARRRFTPQQQEVAVALCLAEGLTCTAVAQRLGIPVSSLAKWDRQARIERAELVRLCRKKPRAQEGKGFFRLAASAPLSIPSSRPLDPLIRLLIRWRKQWRKFGGKAGGKVRRPAIRSWQIWRETHFPCRWFKLMRFDEKMRL